MFSIGFLVNAQELESGEASTETEIYIATDTDAENENENLIITDEALYLSEQYCGKSIDDIYSMLVSIRNILLLFFFAFCLKWFSGKITGIFRRFKE